VVRQSRTSRRGNYFSHLSNIFTVARPAWGYPLSRQEFNDAITVTKKLGLIRKGNERNRRPTLEELDRLMEHFGRVRDNRPLYSDAENYCDCALFDAAAGGNHAFAVGRS
jgi:hypothetical protein